MTLTSHNEIIGYGLNQVNVFLLYECAYNSVLRRASLKKELEAVPGNLVLLNSASNWSFSIYTTTVEGKRIKVHYILTTVWITQRMGPNVK